MWLTNRISAPLSWVGIAMCFIELCERASYYGCQYIFQNFVRGKLPVGGNGAGAVAPGAAGTDQSAGALGLGSVKASAIASMFTFLAYVIPIFGAIIADTKWGRFKTICVGTGVGVVAHFLLVIPAIPAVIPTNAAFPLFVIFLVILAFAAGFIKPSLAPLLCDQSPVKVPTIAYTKKGEKVIIDPQATVQRYLLIFYWCINVGALFGLATTYSERFVGFWLAFLEPGILYALSPIVLFWCSKRLYKAPPQGSVFLETCYVFREAFSNGNWKRLFKRNRDGASFWDVAKPSYMHERDGTLDTAKVFWDDRFVDEIKDSIKACQVFFIIPIFILADGGIGAMENAMSAGMRLDGAPNDVMNNFNSLLIIVAVPIITYGLYPFFEKIGRPIKPMTRMFIGFQLGTINMIGGAIMQWKVYQTSPCGYYASDCEAGVSSVSLWWQLILYGVPAIGEIFVNVTAYELAYTRAPARMKGLVYAIGLFPSAIAAAISLACSAAITDPYLIWPYVALAVASFLTAFIFPTYFRSLNEPMTHFQDAQREAGLYQPNYIKRDETYAPAGEDIEAKERI